MSVQNYGHGNNINLSGFNTMAKFMRETSASHLPPITRYALSSGRLDLQETVRAIKTNTAPMHYTVAFPNEDDKHAPVFGLAITLDHLFPQHQSDDDAVYDEINRVSDLLQNRNIHAHPFTHSIDMNTPMQYAIFIPYTMVRENEGMTVIEGNPKQIDSLLDVLLEEKILNPKIPEHRAMIEDCFSLRTRTHSPYLEL